MTHILHRQIHHAYPVAVGGEGITITDSEGRCYIDASGGAAVSCLGHQHPDVLAAMHAELDLLAYAHTSFFTSQPAEELADELAAHAPGDLHHVYFVSGGSEGIETALKLARQYFVERGDSGRRGSSRGCRAITATRWARFPSAATPGARRPSNLCWSKPTMSSRAMHIAISGRMKAPRLTAFARPRRSR